MLRKWQKGEALVWLTDEKEEAEKLCRAGKCAVFVLTEDNRDEFASGVEWCAEAEADWGEFCQGESCQEGACAEEARREALEAAFGADWLLRVWQRHAGLPWTILETERLVLREMTEADLDALYEIQGEEADGFLEPLCKDREEQRVKIQEYIRHMYGFYGFGIWMMEGKESGRTIGRAGLQLRDGFETPELGFAVAATFRRRSYAEEACRAVMEYARRELGFDEIRAVVRRDNGASRRLCEKLGLLEDNGREGTDGMWIFYRGQTEKDKSTGF